MGERRRANRLGVSPRRVGQGRMPGVVAGGEVRLAAPEDAWAVGGVHVACWREAYARLFSPAFLAAQDVAERRRQWARRLAAPGQVRYLVAVVDEQVVGLAWAASSGDNPPVRDLELVGLYLLATHHGAGLGQALLDSAIGNRPASLWMAEDNPRARAFYARNGFIPDGARKVEPAWQDLTEVRLVR